MLWLNLDANKIDKVKRMYWFLHIYTYTKRTHKYEKITVHVHFSVYFSPLLVHWWIQVAPPASAPPSIQILSFLYTNFLQCRHVGPWRPPTELAPPFGKSWIRHCGLCLFISVCPCLSVCFFCLSSHIRPSISIYLYFPSACLSVNNLDR